MREGHRELCPPDPNVPAAPGSAFGAHFLSASETKSFCSTDLKLWRCLLHRLDLMQLKFCVNLNKILEVIRFLLMTVFFVSPCICMLFVYLGNFVLKGYVCKKYKGYYSSEETEKPTSPPGCLEGMFKRLTLIAQCQPHLNKITLLWMASVEGNPFTSTNQPLHGVYRESVRYWAVIHCTCTLNTYYGLISNYLEGCSMAFAIWLSVYTFY